MGTSSIFGGAGGDAVAVASMPAGDGGDAAACKVAAACVAAACTAAAASAAAAAAVSIAFIGIVVGRGLAVVGDDVEGAGGGGGMVAAAGAAAAAGAGLAGMAAAGASDDCAEIKVADSISRHNTRIDFIFCFRATFF